MGTRSDPRRRNGRSNGIEATSVFLFIIVIIVVVMLSMTVFFNVDSVRVTGASNYTPEEIIAACGITPESNLIRVNTSKTSDNILKKLVYIENAEVSRSFPHTLVVNVEASVPAANFITETGAVILISKGGKVLDKINEPKAGLLNFYGTDPDYALVPGDMFASNDEVKQNSVYKLLEVFNAYDSEHYNRIDVTDSGNISYVYDGRITVELGSVSDIDYKMNFSGEIIRKKIGEKTEGVLTILSDANRASFLDKDTLERNAQVYGENLERRNREQMEENAEFDETEEQPEETTTAKIDPIME